MPSFTLVRHLAPTNLREERVLVGSKSTSALFFVFAT